jgi:hypothetical protein
MEPLSKECFADQYNCKYPIHTKEAAYKSYTDYCNEKSGISDVLKDEIEANFQKAASFHDIKLEEPVVKTAAREMHTLAEEGAAEGISMPVIASMEEIEQSKAFLLEKRASMSCKSLREASKYLLWAASNSKTDLNEPEMKKIAQIAGVGVGDKDEILEQFDKRATLIELPVDQQAGFWLFSRALHAISDDDFYKEATLTKICDTMDEIDRMYGLNEHYGKKMGDSVLQAPEQVCFGQTIDDLTKEAADMLHVPSVDVVLSKKAVLERSDAINGFFNEYFGAEKAENDEKLLEKVASMDENTANALFKALGEE